MDIWEYLLDFMFLISASIALGVVFEKLKQSAVVGYLAAGILLGPGGIHSIKSPDEVSAIAELGVAMLLFSIGLEFSFARLKELGKLAVGGGTLQIGLTSLVMGGAAWMLDFSLPSAIAIGLILAPSSTACVLQVLHDRSESESLHGRNSLGILLFQDAALVPMVVIVAALGSQGAYVDMLVSLAKGFGLMAVLVLAFFIVTIFLLPYVLSQVAAQRKRELPVLLSVGIALSAAWVAHAMGTSPALGAFVAGILLSESPFATQIRSDIAPLKVLFVTLFFASMGMLAELRWIAEHIWLVLGMAMALLAVKTFIIWGVVKFLGYRSNHAAATGMCLSQVGEFSFVLAGSAAATGILPDFTFQLILSAAIITLFLTPAMVRLGSLTALSKRAVFEGPGQEGEGNASSEEGPDYCEHVPVIGFGPAGQQAGKALKLADIPTVVVEMNPTTVKEAQKQGIPAEIGDATTSEMLERLKLNRARGIVIALPDHRSALQVLQQVRRHYPSLPIIVRSRFHRYAEELRLAGGIVVDEEYEAGSVMAQHIKEHF